MKKFLIIKNKKYFYLLLSIIIIILSITGLLSIIGIYNYTKSWEYRELLSLKTGLDSQKILDYQKNKEFNDNYNSNEFRRKFTREELSTGKFKENIAGIVLKNDNIYKARIDSEKIFIEDLLEWNWKWYNWIGIGIK